MDKKIYLNNLYDYYYLLLTDNQRAYYEDYYFIYIMSMIFYLKGENFESYHSIFVLGKE